MTKPHFIGSFTGRILPGAAEMQSTFEDRAGPSVAELRATPPARDAAPPQESAGDATPSSRYPADAAIPAGTSPKTGTLEFMGGAGLPIRLQLSKTPGTGLPTRALRNTGRETRATLAATLVAAAGLLASCTVGPNYHRPDLKVPAAFASAAEADRAQPVLAADWWTLFRDADLNRIELAALGANQDIQAAIARVDGARAAVRGARSSFFPSLNLEPSASRARAPLRGAGGSATSVTGDSISLPLDLGYELDLWGSLRRQYEYFSHTAEASAADLAFVRQTVAADVAQDYFTLRFYDSQVEILEKNLRLFHEQLDLTTTKFKAGLALQTDVLQAETQANTATNQLIEVRRFRAKEEHAIAILLGLPPSEFALEARPLPTTIPVVPAGLPSNLLSRRPDVANAEHTLAAANAEIGMAVANFFPSINLTGSAGFESTSFQHLTDWKNRVWSVGAGLNLPIFEGGKLTAALAGARANYAALLAAYQTAVLTAFQDVEDQLSDLHFLADEAQSLDTTLVSAREYLRLTQLQYKQGLATYLQVINADQTLLANEIAAAQTQNQRLAATVLLIKALGGGWSPVSNAAGKL